jgi:neutral ceramidase
MEPATSGPAGQGGPGPLLAGAAAVEFSVPAGSRMSGFAAREAPAAGVHDALTVRALVIDDFCWLTVDVCGLDTGTCQAIADRVPFAQDRVVVSATHTHAGPCAMPGGLGECDLRVVKAITAAAVEAAARALLAREPCTASYQSFTGLGVARNRRHAGRDVDPALQVIVFRRRDQSVCAWLVQYPCHPVVLGADNLLLSGDYPAFVRSYLERVSPRSTAVFLTGAAGDINTGHSAESSYSRTSTDHRTFAEAERIGTLLGTAAAGARNSARLLCGESRAASAGVELHFEALDAETPDASIARWTGLMRDAAPGQRALYQVWIDWAARERNPPDLTWQGTVTVLRLGTLLLVALPGEPFLECAERIQEGFATPVVVGAYSNGCPGYFPTAEEYARGGYEVEDAHRYYGMPAPFKRGSAEKLVETAITLGRQLL